jgi:hypothetical protein
MGNKIQQKIRKKKLGLEFFGFIISFYHHNHEKNSKRKRNGNLWCGWLSKSGNNSHGVSNTLPLKWIGFFLKHLLLRVTNPFKWVFFWKLLRGVVCLSRVLHHRGQGMRTMIFWY